MLTLSDRAYMPHARVDGVGEGRRCRAIAGTSHVRADGEHRQTGWEPSIWISDGVLDRKVTYPKEQFLSRTRESTG